ncbi:MAG: HIT family protein [Paludibacter sp.]|nr:HIT family protein [Paludibacter sp.]
MTLFTKIIRGDIPCYKIAEDEKFFAFLDISPMTKGHTLVVPKIEEDYIFDLEDELLGDMMIFSKKIAVAIQKALPCVRVGIVVLGMEIPHAHIHLVPLNNESDLNFRNPKLKLDSDEMSRIADQIRNCI